MANVPGVPLPQVGQESRPTPLVDVRPPDEAFGANVASQGAGALGQGAKQMSDALAQHAIQLQGINNRIAADAKSVSYSKDLYAATEAFREANQGVDPKTGLVRAQQNLPAFLKDWEGKRQQAGQGLPLPAFADFDSATRRMQFSVESGLSTFAATETHKARVLAHKAMVDQWVNTASTAPTDADAKTAIGNAVQELGRAHEYLGVGPEEGAMEVRQTVGKIWTDRVDRILPDDPIGAQKLYDEHKNEIAEVDPKGVLAYRLKTRMEPELSANIADGVWGKTFGTNSATGMPTPKGGAWDADLGAFRKDPVAALKSLGINVDSVNSGYRPGAVTDRGTASEHGDNAAWDIPAARGMTLAQTAHALAANLHSFDQIEISLPGADGPNGHVHVGFGEKNRGEIIEKQANGTYVKLSGEGAPPPGAVPSVSLRQIEAAAPLLIAQARAEAQRQQPENALFADRAEITMRQKIERMEFPLKQQMNDDYNTAISYTLPDENGNRLTAPPMSDPKFAEAYGRLLPSEQWQVDARFSPPSTSKATPDMEARREQWQALFNNPDTRAQLADSSKFNLLSPEYADMPLAWHDELFKMQKKAMSGFSDDKAIDAASKKAIAFYTKQTGMSSSSNQGDDRPEYNNFAANLRDGLRTYQAVHGKLPDEEQLEKYVSKKILEQQHGGLKPMWTLAGAEGTVPNSFVRQYAEYAHTQGRYNIPDSEYVTAYRNWQARQKK